MGSGEPWLKCRTNGENCILARDNTAYYIIRTGKYLDLATAYWLKEQGISEELLKELKLPFEYIPKVALRGVAIGGCTAQQNIFLYLKSKKQRLILLADYDLDWMESFFQDVPRFTPPTVKLKKGEKMRESRQDPALFHKLRFVAPACLVLGLVGSIGYVITEYWGFYTLCLVLLAAQIGLVIGMPDYFSFALPKEFKQKNVWELDIPLEAMLIVLLLRYRMNFLDDRVFWICAAVGIAAAFVIYLFVEDIQRHRWALLGVLIYGALCGWYIIGQSNEVYDFSQPESYVLQVEDIRSSGGKFRSHYCDVTLPDGREVSLSISRSLYSDLKVGDLIQVEHGVGIFGIEYANACRYQEGK